MGKNQAIELMKSSTSKEDWNNKCDQVKAANGGQYPEWWYAEIVISGLCDQVLGAGSSQIRFQTY